MTLLTAFLFLTSLARAEIPVLAQDPLCDTSVDFGKTLEQARPAHLKYPQFRPFVADQNKWFNAATKEMRGVCDADKKFAAEILKRDRSALTGQCKPAGEAAIYDQEVLEHSESNLNILRTAKDNLLSKGISGSADGLKAIFARNYRVMKTDTLGKFEVPLTAICEMQWIYPSEFFKNETKIEGCPPPPGAKLSDEEKKDSGVFARMLTRFDQSIDYNQARRNNALATATASMDKYEDCVAQHPGEQKMLIVKDLKGKAKGKASAPRGASPKSSSDITGVQEDKEKRAK